METRNVFETDDEVQALALQEALEAEGIAAVLVNHRDTAYPGITDRLRHGTEIRVEVDQVDEAKRLIKEFIAAQPVEGPPVAPPAAIPPVRLILLHSRHSTHEFWPRDDMLAMRDTGRYRTLPH